MIKIKTNLTSLATKIRKEADKKSRKSLVGQYPYEIKRIVNRNFYTLVDFTPQWAGTTAASWNLYVGSRGFLSEGEGGEVNVRPPRTRDQALSAGHHEAVNISMTRAIGKLEDLERQYKKYSIFVSNNAPGALTAEFGPLRPENAGNEKGFQKFQQDMRSDLEALARKPMRKTL